MGKKHQGETRGPGSVKINKPKKKTGTRDNNSVSEELTKRTGTPRGPLARRRQQEQQGQQTGGEKS